jgi:hypothetical protein
MCADSETTGKTIKLNGLRLWGARTPKKNKRRAWAERFRPRFDALEALNLMDGGMRGAVAVAMGSTGGGQTARLAEVRRQAESAPPEFVKYKGASDASAALPVGNGDFVFVGDDKSDIIRLYNSRTGALKKSIPFITNLGANVASDIEGVTRVGNVAYWIGSGGKFGSNVIFATEVIDRGAESDLKFLGKVTDMQEAIKAWGKANPMFKVTRDGKTEVTLDTAIENALKGSGFDKSWYNIEGVVANPAGTTAYIAFRAPLVKQTVRVPNGGTKVELGSFLLPVTNFTNLFPDSNGDPATTKTPTFGTPIVLEGMGGRGIRDIVDVPQWNRFLILGGNTFNGTKSTLLYTWNGVVTNGRGTVSKLSTDGVKEPGTNRFLSFEAIGSVTGNLNDGTAVVQLLSDDGGSPHGKGVAFDKRFFWGQFYAVK